MSESAEKSDTNKTAVTIPKSLSDVNSSWLSNLLKVIDLDFSENFVGLSHLQILPFETPHEGMFDQCRVSVEYQCPKRKIFNWVIQIVPQIDPDLKEIIVKHKLFQKCILVYGQVLPTLNKFLEEKSFEFHLPLPNLVYSNFQDGCGVMVMEDWAPAKFKLDQPDLMRLVNPVRIETVVRNMAVFHGVATAFQLEQKRELEEVFPLLGEDKGSIWFQDDMKHVLSEMYDTCLAFLKSIPGQEEASQWFELKMSQPSKLQQRNQNLKTLVHGDLWHNNIYFNTENSVLFNDWQMCHTGTPANDLCFFLFSSTTTIYRQNNWESILRIYYDTLITTLRDLGTTEEDFSISYEEFLCDVKASIPLSLFFCLNMKDIEPSACPESISYTQEMEQVFSHGSSSAFEGSFHKLQTCFSLFQINDPSGETILESDNNENDVTRHIDDVSSDSDSDGIVLNFNRKENSLKKKKSDRKLSEPDLETTLPKNTESSRPLMKVPTVATDREIQAVEESRQLRSKFENSISPRKARALRRRLYLDLYKEASSKMLI